jgi:hypothetical protein
VETAMNTSAVLNTRSQLALNKEVGEGTSQVNTTMEVITTPRKKKGAVKKKLTARKANSSCHHASVSMLLYDFVMKLWTCIQWRTQEI